MPEGIIAHVEGGFATIDFVDPELRGPALNSVIDAAGPGVIETITRDGPRRKYRMPLGNAVDAGLVDGDESAPIRSAGHDTGAAAALAAADPNAQNDGVDWHTPVAEHTSANAFVGTVDNDAVLDRVQVFTGDAAPVGGHAVAPAHDDLIADAAAASAQRFADTPNPVRPAPSQFNTLADHPAALVTDPGAIPDGAPHPLDGVTVETFDVTAGDPLAEVTEVTPDETWTRAAINRYAAEHGLDDPEGYSKKADVLDALRARAAGNADTTDPKE